MCLTKVLVIIKRASILIMTTDNGDPDITQIGKLSNLAMTLIALFITLLRLDVLFLIFRSRTYFASRQRCHLDRRQSFPEKNEFHYLSLKLSLSASNKTVWNLKIKWFSNLLKESKMVSDVLLLVYNKCLKTLIFSR